MSVSRLSTSGFTLCQLPQAGRHWDIAVQIWYDLPSSYSFYDSGGRKGLCLARWRGTGTGSQVCLPPSAPLEAEHYLWKDKAKKREGDAS